MTTAGEGVVFGDTVEVAGEIPLGGVSPGTGVVIPGGPGGGVTEDEFDELAADVTALDDRITAVEQRPGSYWHDQPSAAAVWQVHHHLGYLPTFTAYDLEGREIRHGGISHPVPGQISEVAYGAPFAGSGYAS